MEEKSQTPASSVGDMEKEHKPDNSIPSENDTLSHGDESNSSGGESQTEKSSPEPENNSCDIPESDERGNEEGDELRKDKDRGIGSQSAATTPSVSGQDSGVGLSSPDDSSGDVSGNGTISETVPLSSEEASERNEQIGKETSKNASTSEAKSCDESLSAPASCTGTDSVTVTDSCDAADNSASGDSAESPPRSDQESVYYIKWILFNQAKVPIITQNENGPCPLLAIMNVLLLNGKVKLAPMMEMVTSEQLMTYLGDCILENKPQNLTEMNQPHYEQNVQDAMGVMYKLQTGLDVNVRFTGVGDFEYTPECIIFDLLAIALYHGWLVDPQDSATTQAIDQCSYNQLVESIISRKSSQKEDEERKGLIAEQFLDRTATQLTYHGLCELASVVKEHEMCVFFRNNHFNTLYKHNNELFLLVTDQGYMTEGGVVWETLSNVEGDGHFVDAQFRTYTKPAPSVAPIPDPDVPVGSAEQIDHDYQVALSLQVQEDDGQQPVAPPEWPTDQEASVLADHELALRLQEQEHQSAMSEQQQQQQQEEQRHAAGAAGSSQQGHGRHAGGQGSSSHEGSRRREDPRDKDSKCSIL